MNGKHIFRRVLSVDYDYYTNRYNLGLECGHRLEGVPLAKRKACPHCKVIEQYANLHPVFYDVLVNRLHRIPMDDRANVMVEWVRHLTNSHWLFSRGIHFAQALALSQEPSSYPLLTFLQNEEGDEAIGSPW